MKYWYDNYVIEMVAVIESIEKFQYPQLVVNILPLKINVRIYGSFSKNKEGKLDNIIIIIEDEELNTSEVSTLIII